jgi:hypothetical protein
MKELEVPKFENNFQNKAHRMVMEEGKFFFYLQNTQPYI